MEFNTELNKELVKEYPFLLPRNRWTDEVVEGYDYSYTELDAMPDGWRIAFGEEMCREIKQALEKENCLDEYRIAQIKEKWGMLRWFGFGAPREVFDIIGKYSALSAKTCIVCGKPATRRTTGYIEPYCDDCLPKYEDGTPWESTPLASNADDAMVERMADSFSMMDDEEKRNWSMESAAHWVKDENLYADSHKCSRLPYDTEDVYDTIKAMIEADSE